MFAGLCVVSMRDVIPVTSSALTGEHDFIEATMDKLPEVETAKALMTEAVAWSVVKWLREKKRVRKTADQANAALDQLHQGVKDRWPEDVKVVNAKKVKAADDEAYRAHMDAEATFDEAERQLSTSLAREGCQKAIQSWDLHEKAIRKAEALIASQ